MSKFKITSHFDAGGQPYHYLESVGAVLCVLEGSDLADLVSCATAALAEQNSRVMSGKCVCPDAWPARICDHFIPDGIRCCEICGHLQACHSTQNTENQGE